MKKNLNNYFSTGEFAKLCNVKKQTLFHYDDIGIFSPEIKAPNGYRFYSFTQLETFNVITILKELNMPLSDIKQYLDNRSPKEFISLMEKKNIEIINKIKELEQMSNLINKKISMTKEACKIDFQDIYLENLPKTYLIKTDAHATEEEKSLAVSLAQHINYCKDNNIYSPYIIGGMISIENIKNKKYSSYVYFFTQLEDNETALHNHIKEEGLYLTAYHEGGYYTIDKTYDKILKFLDSNNLLAVSYFYEDVLLDDFSVNGYENYVLKISVKVEDNKAFETY